MLCWSLVDLKFCALSCAYNELIQLWQIHSAYVWLFLLWFFPMEFTEQGPVKFSVLIIRSLWTDIRDADFLYMCKESRRKCLRWFISATDFYIYVRDKYFRVYVKGRKKEIKKRKAQDKPCGSAHTDTDFWIWVGYTDFSAYMKGRKDERKEAEGRRR